MQTKPRAIVLTDITAIATSVAYAATTLTESVQSLDDRSREIVTSMGDFLDELSQFAFTAKVEYDRTLESGTLVEAHEVHDVAVKRPGQLRATVLGESGLRAALISEALRLSLILPRGDISNAKCPIRSARLLMSWPLTWDCIPSADFIYRDAATTLLADVKTSE
ncbi:MAG: DUF2092 domain-containing protein [Planctomycetota bacterium]